MQLRDALGRMAYLCSVGAAEREPRWQRGQTLAIVALMLVALIAMLALVIDVGNIYSERRMLQNAADSGALAGARALAAGVDEAGVQAAVNDYAVVRNRAESYEASILSSSVVVTARRTCKTYFAGIVGWPTFPVWAVAEAGYRPGGYGCVMPIGVRDGSWVEDEPFTIWDSKVVTSVLESGIIGMSDRGWLNLDGESASDQELREWISGGGYTEPVCPSGWPTDTDCLIDGTQGSKADALHAMDDLLQEALLNGEDGVYIVIPVFDQVTDENGNEPEEPADKAHFRVTGFAQFFVTAVEDQYGYKYIQGRFTRYVSDCAEAGPPPLPDYGVEVIKLWR